MEIDAYVKKLQLNDLSAFEFIYADTKDYLYYQILAIVKDRHVTEELLQDTYLKMHKKIKRYKEKHFYAWIGTIARNTALNYVKKKKVLIYDQDETSVFQSDSTMDEVLLISDMERILDESEMNIVLLHTLHSYPHRKIGELLDLPTGTVSWKYKQAIQKLREGLNI